MVFGRKLVDMVTIWRDIQAEKGRRSPPFLPLRSKKG